MSKAKAGEKKTPEHDDITITRTPTQTHLQPSDEKSEVNASLSLSQTHTNTHTPDMGHTLWPTSLISFIQPLRSLLSGSFSPSRLWSIHPPSFQLIRHVVTFVTLQRDSRFLWNVQKLACAQTQGRQHWSNFDKRSQLHWLHSYVFRVKVWQPVECMRGRERGR